MKDWFKNLNKDQKYKLCVNISLFIYYLRNLEIALQYNLTNELNDERLIRFKEIVEEYDFLLEGPYEK